MRKMFVNFLISCLIATFSVVGVTVSTQPAAATGGFQSTMGLEFWVNFDENLSSNRSPKLYLSGAQNANVTITWPDLTTELVAVTAGAVTTVDANAKINTAGKYTTSVDGVSQTAVRIVASSPISVYVLNQRTYSSDASQAYPTEYQGGEYFIVVPGATSLTKRFSVIANEAGTTTLTVTPKTTLGARLAGNPYTVTLNQGDVYSIGVSGAADPTGTMVTADKKVTVSSTNGCGNLIGGACDHMTEFIPPTTTWGKSFIVPATINTSTTQLDLYRIIASQANTTVTINGTNQTLTTAGDFYQGQISAVGEDLIVSADKPVLVMQAVMNGSFSDGATTATGDPSMVVVTPVVQYLNDLVITTPATGFVVNSVTLVVPVSDVGIAKLDGVVIPAGDYSATLTLGSANFKVARKSISLGTHSINSTNGVGVFVYGFNSTDSYAYGAAAGLVDLVQNPGGVAQVGYVAAAQVGNPNPPQQAPANAGPRQLPIFFNRVISLGTTGNVRLLGLNLDGLATLQIGEKSVQIIATGAGYAEVRLPELAAGIYRFSTTGTNDGGGWIGTQEGVLTIEPLGLATTPGSVNAVWLKVPSFAPGSSTLTASMRAALSKAVNANPGMKSVTCVGSTSGPTVLAGDAALALRRAKSVCSYISSIVANVALTSRGVTSVDLGAVARRVDVEIKF